MLNCIDNSYFRIIYFAYNINTTCCFYCSSARFQFHICSLFYISILVQQPQGQEATTDDDDDIPLEDSSQFRVVDLRKMVQKAVMKDGNEIFL